MHKKQEDKKNMPFLDTVKTTAVIGLLMQQAASLHCQDGSPPRPYYANHLFADNIRYAINPMMEESLGFIKELTAMLGEGYILLAGSSDGEQREHIISSLDPTQVDLVELQLRGLEGAVRNAYMDCAENKTYLLKPALITIAQARSAAAKLNNLISQMTSHVDTFESSIDMRGLQALTKHGTEVFSSGRFH